MVISRLKRLARDYLPRRILIVLFKINDALVKRSLEYRRFVDADNESRAKSSALPGVGNALTRYFDLVLNFDHRNPVAIDCAHNIFVIGSVLSKKPRNLLELGVGSGYLTLSLLHAIKYNGIGQLTSVDNWFDTHGLEPKVGSQLRAAGANVVCSSEKDFVVNAPTDAYDFLISDADHHHSAEWLDQHLRIVEHNGFIFFHDTNQPGEFPGLATIEARVKELGIPFYHFKESSRPDENCNRGLLFVINKKRN